MVKPSPENSQSTARRLEKILFVDDDVTVCEMAGDALRTLGHPYAVVSDGSEAWRLFEKERHEIVFTDLHLPGLGGHELLRKVKAAAPATDLIVVTGYPTLRSAIKTFKDGALDYLLKPIDRADLHRVVERCTQARQLRERLITEQQVRRKYEELCEIQTQFLANISHELRTPLHVILGYADLLSASIEDPDQLFDVARLAEGARGLAEIVENLIALAQIDSGERTPRLLPTDVTMVLQGVAMDAGETAHERGLEMQIDLGADIGEMATDPDILRRLVTILFDNSLKFTQSGSICLRAAQRADRKALEIEVSDTGIGIPEELVETVFEDFRQGDGSSTRRVGGVGLGLSVARRLVELLDGEISAANRPGGGTSFRVVLPYTLEGESGHANGEAVVGSGTA